jgi:SAM-dependent methyltransferase
MQNEPASDEPAYDPERFWGGLLAERFDVTGTGHGGFGPRYNEYLYRAKARALRRAFERSRLSLAGASVLDVGCGTGFFRTVAKAQGCAAYTGLDITQVSVERLRARFPEDRFVQADIGAARLPPELETQRFGVVACLDVIYHVVDPDAFARAVDHLWSLVAPGGHLLLVDAFWRRNLMPAIRPGDIPHVVFHRRADYDRLLLGRPELELRDLVPMYYLFNRPIVGDRFPWNRRRVSWHLRRRVLESRGVLSAMYALDGALTRVTRGSPSLAILVARKRG